MKNPSLIPNAQINCDCWLGPDLDLPATLSAYYPDWIHLKLKSREMPHNIDMFRYFSVI